MKIKYLSEVIPALQLNIYLKLLLHNLAQFKVNTTQQTSWEGKDQKCKSATWQVGKQRMKTGRLKWRICRWMRSIEWKFKKKTTKVAKNKKTKML